MKKHDFTFFLLACCAITAAQAEPDIAHGQKVYNRSCALCHGKQAEKPAMGQSQIINTFTQDQIINALQDRKSGKIEGAGNRAKSTLSEQDMQDVAGYVETLKK
ncbi:c-type cytochrome [Aggregatibacter actinomycetemcomitans]|uniref:c-type cytochrome n=1 Tax=Aggregatibacter actinomycetemcomitans TaxID=714 RepID=UPI00197BE39D|nr:c-type cytochrome [Aggregatibacter actinomycetemcomitans]MBN6069922.1 c-type cytochrome [Aggregatibacter actinomycetemcomitans]